MMKNVATTAEVLIYKLLKRHNEEAWVHWAYEMLLAGYETENLVVLAGMRGRLEYFEMWTLTDKVLEELGIDYSDNDKVVNGYISYMAQSVLFGEEKPSVALDILKNLYYDLDHEILLSDFRELYYAWEDLQSSEHQWYVDGVDRSNIDQAIIACFSKSVFTGQT